MLLRLMNNETALYQSGKSEVLGDKHCKISEEGIEEG